MNLLVWKKGRQIKNLRIIAYIVNLSESISDLEGSILNLTKSISYLSKSVSNAEYLRKSERLNIEAARTYLKTSRIKT